MIRRWFPHPLLWLLLMLVWVALNGSYGPGQWLLGAVLGWAIALFTQRFWPERVTVHRPLRLLRYVGIVLRDILVSSFVVARLILGSPDRLQPRFFRVPLVLKGDLAISLLANTISLTPGTVSVALSPDRRSLLVHGLDVPDEAATIADIKSRYEAALKEIFEP
jgi:multicomponent K+:H+ antiporter subunit E